jgi:hypothetical protein
VGSAEEAVAEAELVVEAIVAVPEVEAEGSTV